MLWKDSLREMKPYKPGKSIKEVLNQYQLEKVVKLASNENPYGPAPSAKKLLDEGTIEIEMYPDGNASSLRKKIARKLNVNEDSLLFGGGSDEIIVMISRALLDSGKNTIMATPTFPQYAHNAKIDGAEIREVALVDGHHNLDGFLNVIDKDTSVIWLCSPNNPTGNLISSEALTTFLTKVPDNILVVLDEAYFEYITDPSYTNTIHLLKEYPNLIVLRTFSKAYGLAAFRIGYAIGNPEVISNLNKVRSPFNVTSAGQVLAEAALDDDEFIKECSLLNHEEMQRFIQYANANKLHIYDSEANFVLIEVPGNGDLASEKLLQQGFIVRSGEALGTPGYIRVTIGSENQNNGFFAAFDSLLADAQLLK
ncbi:histidinol-phosphate transaminase [Sporosarcina sp. FA9]|uniref:histidinol-phosphate transaminase n=1 Tax=Sporosarcina sp. FA9 TaxID=3413030 RepID=UPI003F6598B6